MARARSNRNGQLEDAITTLVQNHALLQQNLIQAQAAFQQNHTALQQNVATLVQTQAAFVARMSETLLLEFGTGTRGAGGAVVAIGNVEKRNFAKGMD